MTADPTDIHECEAVYKCDTRAQYRILFRGSLSLVCGDHLDMITANYESTVYTFDCRTEIPDEVLAQ